MGLFDFMGGRISDAISGSKAPDFLGRTKSGGLFGGMNDMVGRIQPTDQAVSPASPPQVTTQAPQDPTPTVDMNFSGGRPIFDKLGIDEGKLFGAKDEPRAMYPAIPNNGDPNAPKPDGPLFGQIPRNQSDQPPQQQMPFFGMQNPMSNMFGMGQM